MSTPVVEPHSRRGSKVVAIFGFIITIAHLVSLSSLTTAKSLEFVDGMASYVHAKETIQYATSWNDMSILSPLRGLGGPIQPFGAAILHPAYWPARWSIDLEAAINLSYLITVMLLHLAVWMLARTAGLTLGASLYAVQAFSLLAFYPFHIFPSICHQFRINPQSTIPTSIATFYVMLVWRLNSVSMRARRGWFLLSVLAFWLAFFCDPLFMPIAFLAPAWCCVLLCLASEHAPVLYWRLASGGCCLLMALAARLPAFYSCITQCSARAMFPKEIYSEVQDFGILTTWALHDGYGLAFYLILMMCSVIIIRQRRLEQRWIAIAVLAAVVGFLAMSVYYVYGGKIWGMPAPSYFEHSMSPIYIVVITLAAQQWLTRSSGWLTRWRQSAYLRAFAFSIVPVFAFVHPQIMPRLEFDPSLPQGPVSALLERELSNDASPEYQGSAALCVGVPGNAIANQLGHGRHAPRSKNLIISVPKYIHNSFDGILDTQNLWWLGVPTLEDYNPLINPAQYYVFSRMLSRAIDYQSRNLTVVTRIQPELMSALGVRFIVTDEKLTHERYSRRMSQSNHDGIELNVYENPAANRGGYSPTRLRRVQSAREAIMVMELARLDHVAVTFDELSGMELTPATVGKMKYEPGGVRVQGAAGGPSLLLLPLLFSNALKIVDGDTTGVRLVRLNIMQTGVLFDRRLDIKIAHRFGPLINIDERRQDSADYQAMGLYDSVDVPFPPNLLPRSLRR